MRISTTLKAAIPLLIANLTGCVVIAGSEKDTPGTADAVRRVDIVTGSARLCETLRDELIYDELAFSREQNSEGLTWRSVWDDASVLIPDWLQAAAISEADFDFDNDAHADRVTVFSYWGFYMKGSVLMVALADATTATTKAANDASAIDFTDARYWFLPCQWDRREIPVERCPGFSQEFDEAYLTMPMPGKATDVRFRARYARLMPIRRDQRSYVVITALDATATGYVAVVEPLPQKKFKRLCLLQARP